MHSCRCVSSQQRRWNRQSDADCGANERRGIAPRLARDIREKPRHAAPSHVPRGSGSPSPRSSDEGARREHRRDPKRASRWLRRILRGGAATSRYRVRCAAAGGAPRRRGVCARRRCRSSGAWTTCRSSTLMAARRRSVTCGRSDSSEELASPSDGAERARQLLAASAPKRSQRQRRCVVGDRGAPAESPREGASRCASAPNRARNRNALVARVRVQRETR